MRREDVGEFWLASCWERTGSSLCWIKKELCGLFYTLEPSSTSSVRRKIGRGSRCAG